LRWSVLHLAHCGSCFDQVLASQKSYMNLNITLEQVLGDHVSNGKNPDVSSRLQTVFKFSIVCSLTLSFINS